VTDFLLNLDVEILFFLTNLAENYPLIHEISFYIARWGVLVYIVLVLVLWFEKTTQKQIRFNHRVIYITAMTLILAFFFDQIISYIIARPRPFVDYPLIHTLPLNYDSTSFPSSHTLNLFAVSLSVYLLGFRKYGAFLVIFAVLVGISRIIGGMHYPSDIICGIFVGGLTAYLIANKNSIIRKQVFKLKKG